MRRKNPDPSALKDLVPGVLRGMRRSVAGPVARIRDAWPAVVGEVTASRTRVTAFGDGRVRVEVASAALKQDLAVFRRTAVLRGLQERLPDLRIRGVSYRVGAVS